MVSSPQANYGNGNIYTTIQRLDSSNAQFGLSNKNTSQERINSLRSVQIDNETVHETIRIDEGYDQAADFGTNDRNPVSERAGWVQTLHQALVENHGYDAKRATLNKLTHNTKIVNIPPDQRGTIADMSV
ncbi:MAG: hypothetical protein PHX61_07290 [Alphaproteobacteria bacterium]|nr:hypothetical protein [Alphaproteobacteria bacterium]OIN87662.1 MAG: hypothetical protein AUJ12_00715 [Alphaproteobacteria bacterium CG1_02_46_17]